MHKHVHSYEPDRLLSCRCILELRVVYSH